MKNQIIFLKSQYEKFSLRERVFAIFLGWSLIYTFFYFVFFKSIDARKLNLSSDIQSQNDEIKAWQNQIAEVNQLANDPLYKNWTHRHESLKDLKKLYQSLLQMQAARPWQNVIQSILEKQPSVTLVQMKSPPPSLYQQVNTSEKSTQIYQQKLSLTIQSRYFDTVTYLQHLEQQLPNIHWNSLDYQVKQYPLANVDMELAVFYEKNK